MSRIGAYRRPHLRRKPGDSGWHGLPYLVRLGACAAAAAVAIGACGSSGGSSSTSASTTVAATTNTGAATTNTGSGSSTSSGPAAASVPQTNSGLPTLSAPDKPAKGTPLTFAMISLQSSSAASFAENTQAAQAAAEYLNTKLDGIAGHPIKIDVCPTDGTPATSAACANRLIQDHPVAFFGDSDLATDASLPLIQKANLAYIGSVGFGGPEDSLPNSFQFVAGSTMTWTAIGEFAVKDLHVKTIGQYQPTGNPDAAIAANLVKGAAVTAGLSPSSIKTVPIDPTAADVTPQAEALDSSNPGAVVGITTGTQCVSMAQAQQSLGSKAAYFEPSGCSDPKEIKDMGSSANGMYMPFEVDVPGDNGPDVRLFKAVMAKYQPAARMDEFAAAGFQEVINTWTVLHKETGPITPAVVQSAFNHAKDVPNFMGPKFTCDHAVKAYPALCNPEQIMYQYENGTWKPVSGFFDPSQYATLKYKALP